MDIGGLPFPNPQNLNWEQNNGKCWGSIENCLLPDLTVLRVARRGDLGIHQALPHQRRAFSLNQKTSKRDRFIGLITWNFYPILIDEPYAHL